MQIIGSFQIVTIVTSVVPTLFGCIALLFFHFAFRFIVLLCSLECAGGFRSCGSDHGLCPLDSHKPLKRLDRNFYMGALLLLFGSSGFVQSCDRGGTPFYSLQQTSDRRPPKKIKKYKSRRNLRFCGFCLGIYNMASETSLFSSLQGRCPD